MKKNRILFIAMEGIGDQIYLRPFVRELSRNNVVYVSTFMPQLFADISDTNDVKFIRPSDLDYKRSATYRTQQIHVNSVPRNKGMYCRKNHIPHHFEQTIDPFYAGEDVSRSSIVASFYKKCGIPYGTDLTWDMPKDLLKYDYGQTFEHILDEVDLFLDKYPKIAVVRAPTIRREWAVPSRNPEGHYVTWCERVLREAGYTVIVVASTKRGEEWIDPTYKPDAENNQNYLDGQLSLFATLELMRLADVVVTGSGFAVPAAIGLSTPVFTIFGGRMLYDNPYNLFHATMSDKTIHWSSPDVPCRCSLDKHRCNKTISHLDTDFTKFLISVNKKEDEIKNVKE